MKLTAEEEAALIAALENGGELLVGTPIDRYWSLGLVRKRSFASQDDDGAPLLDSTWEITQAGHLLARALHDLAAARKRSGELERAVNMLAACVVGLDARCRSLGVDPGNEWFERSRSIYDSVIDAERTPWPVGTEE